MRILELEIANIRGIRNHVFDFSGKSAVILGPNGAGKSAVVDATEFLLTGSIGRLSGIGTGEISFSTHGPHIDSAEEDAWVRAIVEIDNEDDPVEFKRSFVSPRTVDVLRGSRSVLEASLLSASRARQVLTRRELLAFVTADGGTRARRIEMLLDMTEVGEVRRALVRVKNDMDRDSSDATRAKARVEARLATHVGLGAFDESRTLDFVNERRQVLGGSPVETLSPSGVRADLDPVAASRERDVANDIPGAKRALVSVKDALGSLPPLVVQRQESLDELRRFIEEGRLDEIKRVSLLRVGLTNLDGDFCPLCETAWDEDELRLQLEDRKDALEAVSDALERTRATCSAVASKLAIVVEGLSQARETIARLGSEVASELEAVERACRDAEQASHAPVPEEMEAWEMPTGEEIKTAEIESVVSIAEAVCEAQGPAPNPRQEAWDVLTQVEESLTTRASLARDARRAAERKRQARILLEEFERSRDATLGAIYEDIADRFRDLYVALHAEEQDFSASLLPEEAAIHLRVSFYGRGEHVPHALHSEGHQDSMGVCLFLALAERFGSGALDVLLLDDVMMSVDAGHRRALADLLATEFGDTQLILTTHDRQWAKQLQRAGVVTARAIHEFRDWSLDAGPLVAGHQEDLDRAREQLESGSVSGAAHAMRRALEGAFLDICDDLAAPVPFRLTGRYELGDLLPSAVSHMRRLLKKGRYSQILWMGAGQAATSSGLAWSVGLLSCRWPSMKTAPARTRGTRW